MTDDRVEITPVFGWSELRTGWEYIMRDDGTVDLVGMGGRIDYDREGHEVGRSWEPTGIVVHGEPPGRSAADAFLEPITRVARRILRQKAG